MDSEKAKMISGKPYNAFGDELLKERQYAKEQVFNFNSFLLSSRIGLTKLQKDRNEFLQTV